MISIDEINKLQAQNKGLIEQNRQLQQVCKTLAEGLNKRQQTLQEIKGVVTALYMNNWLQMNETARKSIQLLQELITKAEEE